MNNQIAPKRSTLILIRAKNINIKNSKLAEFNKVTANKLLKNLLNNAI